MIERRTEIASQMSISVVLLTDLWGTECALGIKKLWHTRLAATSRAKNKEIRGQFSEGLARLLNTIARGASIGNHDHA